VAGNKARITIPGRLRLYFDRTGALSAPADDAAAWPVGWLDVGLTQQEGVSFAIGFEQLVVMSHQSDYPTRKGITSRTGRISINLQEWSGENLALATGGGEVTELTEGHYKYTPPEGNNESGQAGLELVDGTKVYRFIVPQCAVGEGIEVPLAKTAESILPLTLDVEGQDGVDPWYLLTNDPAFAPPA
jgi:hypothetical protein